ncbi:CHAT domain-containing protein [Sphingobacterium faecale]|uniref:CHAT domain-containing protein n=1 Tax=Sphingobacterium faecale TaxID=2803775 RepID=A0ABS1QZB8_9SPHI|nr:CHAT domain-containing protein [Sphingobacterium faecale]MBL1407778.1 CHAT domain-containing protein [Sphingobacterium faecale]
MRALWLPLYILLLASCHSPSVPVSSPSADVFTEDQLDSIFEGFESIAYEKPDSYADNPDSFFNQITVTAKSSYQKEMYLYGLIFMGYGLLQHGNNLESVKYYEKAYNYVKSTPVEIRDVNTEIIKPLANQYIRINDTQKSISLLQKALLETGDHNEQSGLYNNLANAYLYNGQLDSAKTVLFRAIKSPASPLSNALLFNTLASVYEEEQHKKESAHYNNLALQYFEKSQLQGDTLLWYIAALGQKGYLEQDNRLVTRAIHLVEKEFPNEQNRFKAKLTLMNGNLLQGKALYQEALDAYNKTLYYFKPDGKSYVLDYTYTQSLLGKAKIHVAMEQLDSALYYYEWAIENDFRTQQLIVSSRDQLRNNILNKETIESLIALIENIPGLSQQKEVVQQLLWCIELSKARLLINEINRSEIWENASERTKLGMQTIRDIYRKIDMAVDTDEKKRLSERLKKVMLEFELSERYFETIQFEPQKAKFLKYLNRPDSDFYSYFVHRDSSITIIHKSNQGFSFKKTTTPDPLRNLLAFKAEYFGDTPNNYNRNPKAYNQKAQYLTGELLPQIDGAQHNLFVSLDAQLYGFPFDALYNDDFLVKKHNFAYLNSFLLFDFLTNKTVDNSKITVLYRSQYPLPLPNLQFVDKEVENISSHFSTQRIGPEQQNDAIIREQFAQPHIVHIAAHTILDTAAAPVIYMNQIISTNQLRFYEMKTPLVFLSACNTGYGRPLPSEGTESIQRVFLSKNVPSVISTFWFANDQTMLDLTTSFYKELNETADPICALGEAKRAYLLAADPTEQNPWYWANINYTGIGNKIGLKKSSNLPYYIIGITTLFILLFLSPVTSRVNNMFKQKDKKTDNKTK